MEIIGKTYEYLGMRVLGVIPARYGSTRFPGKPLKTISGKPLLQWVIEGVRTSKSISEIIVATDDERIVQLATACGVRACMTDSELPSGTDRIWAATKSEKCDLVLNIQGDEPLITGEILDLLVKPFGRDASLEMGTLARELPKDALTNPNVVKVILNEVGDAIYFSRFGIPHSREQMERSISLQHIGVYAYRPAFLKRFCEYGAVGLERAEALEQLRALYLGARIRVVQVEHESWGVDTPEDVIKIEKILKQKTGKG